MDYSIDRGKNWDHMNEVDANSISFADAHHGWAMGRKGQILKFEGAVPGLHGAVAEEITPPRR